MGKIRAHSHHVKWRTDEIKTLLDNYSMSTRAEMGALLPTRNASAIESKAHALGLVRIRPPKMSLEQTREAKRLHMARQRAADPQAAREYRNAYHAANRAEQVERMRQYYARRFFWAKAMKLRGDNRATTKELAALWKSQRGRCALTGRRLNRTAQLDHKTAKARGGSDVIDNLQWLCKEANLAKRELSETEFVALCCEVTCWAAKHIQSVEAIQ